MDELLSASGGKGNLRGVGRLDTAKAEMCDLATMEADARADEGLDEAWTGKGSGAEVSDKWPRPLVERWGAAHERSLPKSYFDRCGLVSLSDQRLKFQRTS